MTNQDIIIAIRDLVKDQNLPHEDIFKLMQSHNCENLLLKSPNPIYHQKVNLNRTINSITTIERYKACQIIFNQKQIPYAIIKGSVLSKMLYDDPFLRNSRDIDILISRADADKIKDLLNSNGFFQGKIVNNVFRPSTRKEIVFQTAMTHQMASFVKETENPLCPHIYLDVNTNIIWGESNSKINMNYVLSLVQKTELFGNTFYKLCPEMEFVNLCLHNYKDMNSIYLLVSGSLKLGLYYEIYLYLKKIHLRIEKLIEICENLNVGQYVYTCIYQAQEIFDDRTLDKYIELLVPYKNASLLNTFGLDEKERKCWTIDIIERLFNTNLSEYIRSLISDEEKEKIKINRELI